MSINKLLCVTLGALLGSSSESDNNSIIDEKIQYVITSSSEEASNNNEEESEAHRNAREYLNNLFNKKSGEDNMYTHNTSYNKENINHDEDLYKYEKDENRTNENNTSYNKENINHDEDLYKYENSQNETSGENNIKDAMKNHNTNHIYPDHILIHMQDNDKQYEEYMRKKKKYTRNKAIVYFATTQFSTIALSALGAYGAWMNQYENPEGAAISTGIFYYIGGTGLSIVSRWVCGKWCSKHICKCKCMNM